VCQSTAPTWGQHLSRRNALAIAEQRTDAMLAAAVEAEKLAKDEADAAAEKAEKAEALSRSRAALLSANKDEGGLRRQAKRAGCAAMNSI
jgi:hypothetical protein